MGKATSCAREAEPRLESLKTRTKRIGFKRWALTHIGERRHPAVSACIRAKPADENRARADEIDSGGLLYWTGARNRDGRPYFGPSLPRGTGGTSHRYVRYQLAPPAIGRSLPRGAWPGSPGTDGPDRDCLRLWVHPLAWSARRSHCYAT